MGKHKLGRCNRLDQDSQVSPFRLEGRFLGFAAEDGYKLKLIRLATQSGEYLIKIPKELRPMLYRTLVPGEWVEVSGLAKRDLAKAKLKLKADQIVPTAPTSGGTYQETAFTVSTLSPTAPVERPIEFSNVKQAANPKQETILVCQKSDCCKRGAGALMQTLQQELSDRGLTQQVKIRGTGCMKQCKAGPNLVMPDKSRHSRLRPSEVPTLLDKHFPDTNEIAS